MQHKLDKALVLLLAQPPNEACRRESFAHFVRCEPVLSEAKVEERGDWNIGLAELFLLLGKIGAADEADGNLLAELVQEGEHLGGCMLEERRADQHGISRGVRKGGRRTPRAGVRVLSTSKRAMVFLSGRSERGG